MKQLGTEFFQTSLYEIDRILDEADEDNEETTALIDKLLPAYYAKY